MVNLSKAYITKIINEQQEEDSDGGYAHLGIGGDEYSCPIARIIADQGVDSVNVYEDEVNYYDPDTDTYHDVKVSLFVKAIIGWVDENFYSEEVPIPNLKDAIAAYQFLEG